MEMEASLAPEPVVATKIDHDAATITTAVAVVRCSRLRLRVKWALIEHRHHPFPRAHRKRRGPPGERHDLGSGSASPLLCSLLRGSRAEPDDPNVSWKFGEPLSVVPLLAAAAEAVELHPAPQERHRTCERCGHDVDHDRPPPDDESSSYSCTRALVRSIHRLIGRQNTSDTVTNPQPSQNGRSNVD